MESKYQLVGKIPVRNIWLLLLYASQLYRQKGFNKFEIEENPDELPDLVAEILAHAVEHRLKRNLSLGYQTTNQILNRVRGKINLFETERHWLLARGKVACQFEDLTVDTPRNRYVRAALNQISQIVHDHNLAHRCRSLSKSLKELGVSGEKPTRAMISTDRLSRHDAEDRMMMSAAQLAFNLALPTEETGQEFLPVADHDEHWLRKLFEKAIAGFYEVVLSNQGWRVDAGKTIYWQIEDKTPGIDRILPLMRTDIILENSSQKQRIIIDTKFTSILSSGYYREETLRSGYIYQIYSYLRAMESEDDPLSLNSCGILLHPAIDMMMRETVVIQGHPIRFATVDLSAKPMEIRSQLINLINFKN